ncbi:MAG TPA: hypothetical protein VMK32_10225 [Burkholderiaceae bacterium]|nr:hypothetical protein [Burkholderiaceae bacterium]
MPARSVSCRSAFVASLVAAALLAGCAVSDPYAGDPAARQMSADDAQAACLRRLQTLDSRVDAAGVRDAQTVRVDGYPFLRADRYTVLVAPAGVDPARLARAKVDRMAALDSEARRYEAANLRVGADELAAIDRCRDQLLAAVQPQAEAVIGHARPPAAYSDALRVVGLYPLAQIPFSWAQAAWEQTTRDLYATPFPDLPVTGKRVRYVPGDASGGGIAGWVPVSAHAAAALRQPPLSPERAWQLVRQHAPVMVVQTAGDDDRIGTLAWRTSGGDLFVGADSGLPASYARIAWSEVNGVAVTQIVYSFWFPARPASHPLDAFSGRLDAILWRVTLDSAGRPLVYDSIHADGGFHMFFPTENVRERPGPLEGGLDQTMFAPQVVHSPAPGERVVVYVGAGDHNIERVAIDAPRPAPGEAYAILDENQLRALPLPAASGGGTRSIYGPDGLVAGTERAQRFIYWPTGVPAAGQMRQWGHHATAYVGRRHFDDPRLIDRYFTLAPAID